MDNSILDKYKIDFSNELKKEIINAVVEVYGEQFRSIFEERIERIKLIQYITPEDINNIVNSSMARKRDILTVKFLQHLGFEIPEGNVRNIDDNMKNVLNIYFGSDYFSNSTYTGLFAFDNEEMDNYSLSKRCAFLKKLGFEGITPEQYKSFIETPEGQEKLAEIKGYIDIVKGLIQEYNEFEQEFSDEKKYVKECEQLKKELSNEGIKEYYEKIKELLTEEEQKEVELVFSRDSNQQKVELFFPPVSSWGYSFDNTKCARFFPSDFDKITLIEAFEEGYDSWDKEAKRVEYFKSCGLNLGHSYSAYEQNDDARMLVPSQDVIKKIKEARESVASKVSAQYFMQTGTIGENINEINNLGLLEKTDFSQEFVKDGVICIEPNAIRTADNTIENVNLLYWSPLKIASEYKDISFMHEVLHALEGSFERVGEEYIFCTGFEKFKINIDNDDILDINQKNDKELRKYEIFSENVHHNLAMEATAKLHSRGIRIAGNDEQKITGATSYERFNSVTKDFYNKFKKKIIYARVTGNLDRLITYVGKDNFEQMNELVGRYSKLPYLSMMSDIMNNRKTTYTEEATRINKEAKDVVDNMLERTSIGGRG